MRYPELSIREAGINHELAPIWQQIDSMETAGMPSRALWADIAYKLAGAARLLARAADPFCEDALLLAEIALERADMARRLH